MKVQINPLTSNPTNQAQTAELSRVPRVWRADWRMTLFVLIMLPLVLFLAVWQLDRAAYKQSLMDAYFDKLGALPMELASDPTAAIAPEPFTRVRINGSFLPLQLLLDNQIENGKPGYWVYAPFTTGGATWLVNRGWVAAPRLRTDLPDVAALPTGEVSLVALVWPDTGTLPLFGNKSLQRENDLVVRMQRLDIPALEAMLGTPITGKELRLEAGQPGVLKAAPQTMGFGVERHQGYAFQWFGLAVALVTLYYFYGRSALSNKADRTNDKQDIAT